MDLVAKRAVRILKIPLFLNMTGGTTSGLVQVTSLSVLPNIQPIVTFVLTFLFILPVLWKVSCLLVWCSVVRLFGCFVVRCSVVGSVDDSIVLVNSYSCEFLFFCPLSTCPNQIWKFPHPLAFAHALVYCQMCSFMLGYHVHEKAILMAIVPVGMLAADSVDDAKVYLLMSWIGHISLFPLLEGMRELPSKIMFTSIHMLLSYVSLDRYHRSEQRAIHIEKSKR